MLLSRLSLDSFSLGWLQPVMSPMGREIDHLYYLIMVIVVAIFLLTEGLLVFIIFRFRSRKGRKAANFHGSNVLELIWTLIPALILAVITILSGTLWNRIRINFPKDKDAVVVQVFAEQFAWNFRYAGPDGVFGTPDDVMTINELHIPVNSKVVLKLSSKDVIHSFFIPEARLKQDVVPGLLSRFWFALDRVSVWDRKANKQVFMGEDEFKHARVAVEGLELVSKKLNDNGLRSYSYEPVADNGGKAVFLEDGRHVTGRASEAQYVLHPVEAGCAQLCGTSHFAMRGEVTVEPEAEFKVWLEKKGKAGNTSSSLHKWNDLWDAHHPEFNKPNL